MTYRGRMDHGVVVLEGEKPADGTLVEVTPINAIRRTDGVVGGDARVRNTRIPVWTLVQLKKLGRTEAPLLRDYPGLTGDDLDAAWEYYRDHTDEIEQTIAAEAAED